MTKNYNNGTRTVTESHERIWAIRWLLTIINTGTSTGTKTKDENHVPKPQVIWHPRSWSTIITRYAKGTIWKRTLIKNLKYWKRQFMLTSRRSKTSKSRSQSGRPESGAMTSKLTLLLTLVSFLDIMVLSNETSFNTSNNENIIWYLGRTTLISWEITYRQFWTGAVSHSI